MNNNVFKRSNGVDKLNEKIASKGVSAFPDAGNTIAIGPELSNGMFKVFG